MAKPPKSILSLRESLLKLEAKRGITDEHRAATAKLVKAGARVVGAAGHRAEISSFALSPSGEHLATGAWQTEDYDEGGSLQIWELATGRCVNTLLGIRGGVGWIQQANCVQFRPDGEELGLSFDTNAVGALDPFGDSSRMRVVVTVTNGWDHAPAWCWSPDGARIAISTWGGGSAVPCCIADMRGARKIREKGARWLAKTIAPAIAKKLDDGLEPFDWMRWDDGEIHGEGGWRAYGIDPKTGEVTWIERVTTLASDEVWSRDRKRVAKIDEGIQLYEGKKRIGTLDVKPHDPDVASPDAKPWAWSPDGTKGVCLGEDGRLHVYAVAGKPKRVAAYDAPEDAQGVMWGARDVVVAIGLRSLAFLEAGTGRVIGKAEVHAEPTEVPVDDECAAYVVDRRWAWPLRWGESAGGPKKRAPSKPAEPSEASVDELVAFHLESLAQVKGYESTIQEYVRKLVQLRARRGELEQAAKLIESMRSASDAYAATEQIIANASLAAALARAGETDAAKQRIAAAEKLLPKARKKGSAGFVLAPLATAHARVGDAGTAKKLLAEAEADLPNENNDNEMWTAIAEARLEAGDVAGGLALFMRGAKEKRFASSYLVQFAKALVRVGGTHAQLAELHGLAVECGDPFAKDGFLGVEAAFLEKRGPEAILACVSDFGDAWRAREITRGAILAMHAAGKTKAALAAIEKRIDAASEPNDRAQLVELAARIDPRAAKAWIDPIVKDAAKTVAAAPRLAVGFLGPLASALTHAGRVEDVAKLEKIAAQATFVTDAKIAVYVAAAFASPPDAVASLGKALAALGTSKDADSISTVAKAAFDLGQLDEARELFTRAIKRDDMSIQRCIDAGDLATASEAVAAFTPAKRSQWSKPLILAYANRGEPGPIIALARKLKTNDINDRASTVQAALEQMLS